MRDRDSHVRRQLRLALTPTEISTNLASEDTYSVLADALGMRHFVELLDTAGQSEYRPFPRLNRIYDGAIGVVSAHRRGSLEETLRLVRVYVPFEVSSLCVPC